MSIQILNVFGTGVTFGRPDSFVDFIFRNAIAHSQIWVAVNGFSLPTYTAKMLHEYNGDAWLQDHNAEHLAIASSLGLPAPPDLSDVDFTDKADHDNWMQIHALVHQQIQTGINSQSNSPTPPPPPVGGPFRTFSYRGNGGGQSFIQAGFKPDLVLIFNTAGSLLGTIIGFDSSNGPTHYSDWCSELGNQGSDANSLTSFDTYGFTVGNSNLVNKNGVTYQAFCWQKAVNFFDIQTYAGTGTTNNISHNLTSVPQFVAVTWNPGGVGSEVYGSQYASSPSPWNGAWGGANNGVISYVNSTQFWNATAPTSSVITVESQGLVNTSGRNYTMYLWGTGAGINAYFGTYTGTGVNPGPIVSLGYRPSTIMIFEQTGSNNNFPIIYGNRTTGFLNLENAVDTTNYVNILSTGFQIVTTDADFNSNGTVYQYFAW